MPSRHPIKRNRTNGICYMPGERERGGGVCLCVCVGGGGDATPNSLSYVENRKHFGIILL